MLSSFHECFWTQHKSLRRQKHVLSQSTTPFACTLQLQGGWGEGRRGGWRGKAPPAKARPLQGPLLSHMHMGLAIQAKWSCQLAMGSAMYILHAQTPQLQPRVQVTSSPYPPAQNQYMQEKILWGINFCANTCGVRIGTRANTENISRDYFPHIS